MNKEQKLEAAKSILHEVQCRKCDKSFNVSEYDAVLNNSVTCPHCAAIFVARLEESTLDFQMEAQLLDDKLTI